ncbi:methionine gamma-lyase [Peptostreptococcus faecalis]|uniref:methionine gamma-lyase n=1 Tax=Peptostreptococcus faecalis TaxID=2045015 RepID=UPI000C7D4B65|nr:methionine gamma-lyase [Peptostreptococcus faecalis]
MQRKELETLGFATKAIHGGYTKDLNSGALSTPIYATSTYIFDSAEQGGRRFALEEGGYIYSRLGNPSNTALEEKMAILEGAEACMSTGSGMGAISSALWTALKAGDHVVASDTLYGCTFALLNHGIKNFGVEVDFVDITNPENVKKAIKENTRVVYLETPANPTLKISDIKKISEIAHSVENCLVFVDNTFATPYIQRPIELGADVVLHSATKYLNGHGDVIAGFVLGTTEFITNVRLFGVKDMTGAVLSPFDAFLVARGLKTLELRMERHCANAMKVAEFLEAHDKIEKVYYPGLDSFEQKELAESQMSLSGGIIAFELKGGIEEGKKLLNSLEIIKLAVSLGDAETLIEHPASMTHSPYTKEEREESGISDGLVRLSVGLETADDIIADLNKSLNNL